MAEPRDQALQLEFTVASPAPRLDRYLAGCQDRLTRAHIQKLIASGLVTVNTQPARASQRLHPSDRIEVTVPPPTPLDLTPQPMPLRIVYEDADLLVVDKPPGLVVHPGPGHPEHTLVNALLAHCPDLAGIKDTLRPGIVHRLDKGTSGLLVVAKTAAAHLSLSRQIAKRSVLKGYYALVVGHLSPKPGAIQAPIGRDRQHRKRMAVVPAGREALTRYQVLEYYQGFTLVEVHPETGRTHQIRVHLASLGHPIAGDPLYGGRSFPRVAAEPRPFLHAHLLGFHLPTSSRWVEFTAPLPPDLQAVRDALQPV